MSWPLFLSSHPYPLLEDENALLVLCLIERAGLVGEADLAAISGLEKPALQRHLYQLQLGKFIEHGATFVRLSEAGRDTIDRLALFEDIIADILDSLDAHGGERYACSQELRTYRKSAFRLYQNSLCTLWQWKRLTALLFADADERLYFDRMVSECLLARDLRNWRIHLQPEPNADKHSRGFDSIVHKLIWHILLDIPGGEFGGDAFAAPGRSGAPTNVDLVIAWVRAFHRLQTTCGPDIWFNIWSHECAQLPRQLQAPQRVEYLAHFESLSAGQIQHFNDTWKPGVSSPLSSNFVAHLAAAKSIADLSARLGMSEASLPLVLRAVRQSCARLLPLKRIEERPVMCWTSSELLEATAGTSVTPANAPLAGEGCAEPLDPGREPREGQRESISRQAVLWWLQLKDQRWSLRAQWQLFRWLVRSPRHIHEFVCIWRQQERLTRFVRNNRDQSNVTHVNWWRGSTRKPPEIRRRRRIAGWSVAATTALVTAFIVWFWAHPNIAPLDGTIASAAHEVTRRELEDGSVVALDPGATMRIGFTQTRRAVHLLEGKAVFEVARDDSRPFVVNALFIDVEAAVSRFAVKIDGSVEVAVYDGHVEVSRRGESVAITLRSGDTYRVPLDGLGTIVADGTEGGGASLFGG